MSNQRCSHCHHEMSRWSALRKIGNRVKCLNCRKYNKMSAKLFTSIWFVIFVTIMVLIFTGVEPIVVSRILISCLLFLFLIDVLTFNLKEQ